MNSSKCRNLRSFTSPKEEMVSGTGGLEIACCISRGISEIQRSKQLSMLKATMVLMWYLHEFVHLTSVTPINTEKIAPIETNYRVAEV